MAWALGRGEGCGAIYCLRNRERRLLGLRGGGALWGCVRLEAPKGISPTLLRLANLLRDGLNGGFVFFDGGGAAEDSGEDDVIVLIDGQHRQGLEAVRWLACFGSVLLVQ